MSTNYRFLTEVQEVDLKKSIANIPNLSIHEEEAGNICVTDGKYYLHFSSDEGMVYGCDRYGGNYEGVQTILDPIADDLDVGYLSEHDDGYWEDDDDYVGEEE